MCFLTNLNQFGMRQKMSITKQYWPIEVWRQKKLDSMNLLCLHFLQMCENVSNMQPIDGTIILSWFFYIPLFSFITMSEFNLHPIKDLHQNMSREKLQVMGIISKSFIPYPRQCRKEHGNSKHFLSFTLKGKFEIRELVLIMVWY